MTERPVGSGQRPPDSSVLMELVEREGIHLFNDGFGRAYAATVDGRTWAIPTPQFSSWLRSLLYRNGSRVARGSSIEEAAETLVARALYSSGTCPVFVRVARLDEAVYVDLGDAAWSTVEITKAGWRVLAGGKAPVRFVRPSALDALPQPASGGRLQELQQHINLEGDDDQWSLVAGFLVSAFVLAPRGPFPILVFHGEQGCTKSTASRHCAAVLDPRVGGLRALSRDLEQLAVAADNGFLLAFDNISRIEPAISDGLCRLATGAGYARRTHYQNRDETIFDAARPILMNGIGLAVVRADLLDRAVLVELPPVPASRRRRGGEVAARFKEARPRILGALFDAVALALRNQESTAAGLTNLPRMADFAVVAAAAEPAMGVAPGTFLRAYADSLRFGDMTAASADPVALALQDFVTTFGRWEGSASDLLRLLPKPALPRQQNWPTNANAMANALLRVRPTLPALGIQAERLPRTHAQGRRWRIQPCATTIPLRPVSVEPSSDSSRDASGDAPGDTPNRCAGEVLDFRDARDASPRPTGTGAGGVSLLATSTDPKVGRAAAVGPTSE